MPHLGFMTYGELVAPPGHPSVARFFELGPDAFAQAAGAPGHLATAATDGRDPWGPFVLPDFGEPLDFDAGSADDTRIQTLTVWQDVDAVATFAYSGTHLAALRRRGEWFRKIDAPFMAAWWIDASHTPTWAEACRRIEHLHDHGPTPHAFTVHAAFDPGGAPLSPSRRSGR